MVGRVCTAPLPRGIQFDKQLERWGFTGMAEWSPRAEPDAAGHARGRVVDRVARICAGPGRVRRHADFSSSHSVYSVIFRSVVSAIAVMLVGSVVARYLARSVLIESRQHESAVRAVTEPRREMDGDGGDDRDGARESADRQRHRSPGVRHPFRRDRVRPGASGRAGLERTGQPFARAGIKAASAPLRIPKNPSGTSDRLTHSQANRYMPADHACAFTPIGSQVSP